MTQHWPRYVFYSTSDYYHRDVYGRLERMRKALSELQLKKDGEELERSVSMSALQETENHKEVNEEHQRIEDLTSKIEQQQKEIQNLRAENHELKLKLTGEKQLTNGPVEEDSNSPLSSDTSSDVPVSESSPDKLDNNHLWKRLRDAEEKAYEAECRADNLNLLLNYKLIETNKLQLTLSSQTKDLIQLEKAYYQLRCHVHKNRKASSPSYRLISPKLNNTM